MLILLSIAGITLIALMLLLFDAGRRWKLKMPRWQARHWVYPRIARQSVPSTWAEPVVRRNHPTIRSGPDTIGSIASTIDPATHAPVVGMDADFHPRFGMVPAPMV